MGWGLQRSAQSRQTRSADGSGRRIQRTTGAGSWEYIFDLSGHPVTELIAGTYSTTRTDVFAAGRHLAIYNGDTYFPQVDWLGTERVRTNSTGAVAETYTNNPFGDGSNPGGVSPYHFTGNEHDTETNLDHTLFRQYSANLSRWMTPDPAGIAAADLSNPQSLNRYAYVLNNPLRYRDPLGFDQCAWDDGTIDDRPEDGGATESECGAEGGTWIGGTDTSITVSGGGDGFSCSGLCLTYFDLNGYFNNYYNNLRNNLNVQANTPPTPQQYIRAIANAASTICGGGVFGYLGGEAEGPVHAFSGAVAEYDTKDGGSVGTLSEIGAGEAVFGGYGWISGPGGTSSLGYGGAGIKTPLVSGGAGIVGFSNGVGFFIEGGTLGVKGGGGAYVNVTTNAGCNHK